MSIKNLLAKLGIIKVGYNFSSPKEYGDPIEPGECISISLVDGDILIRNQSKESSFYFCGEKPLVADLYSSIQYMIIGDCPYCNEIVTNAMPDSSPAFCKPTCDSCGKNYWLLCSRIESQAYTIENFEKEYNVDEETKSIKKIVE